MISTVMLDLDDVCNTFAMSALAYVGATECVKPYSVYPEVCGWDIVDAANTLVDPRHIGGFGRPGYYSVSQFWDALDRRFWASVPPAHYLWPLVDYLRERVGRKNIIVATSATISPECLAGKLEWIHMFLPAWMHRNYMIGSRKEFLAQHGVLLIDDRRGNCEKFIKAGGKALQVDKPWNKLGFKNGDTWKSLRGGLLGHFGLEI